MTILFFARRFYPDVGGVEKHVLEIGKRLVKDGHNVIVVTESQGKEKEIKGIRIFRIKTPENWFKKFYIWKWLWKNRSLIEKSDVVHAHDVYYWYFPFRFLFPLKRSFVTFHGYESYPISKRAIIVRKISEKLAFGNIIVGYFIKKWYHTTPVYAIYGGVDVSSIKHQVTSIKKESAIFIGRLDEQTGILDYAKAVDLIKKIYPDFKFQIYGDGKFKKRVEQFKPVGFVKDAEKKISNYNFAFASRYLSILEALANKRLVFALYDNPVKRDYLKMAPFAKFIIIEKTPENLAKKVLFYIKHPEQERMLTEKGFIWVKSQSWEKIVRIYLRLWGF